ncbi:N-6 DNA methylase, partial [bacterium]|nr:N-6 DNA methylase [bacterium]
KDGNKNRLRERDLHQIVDVFTNAEEHPGYSRLVPQNEIEKNDFNLNLPRYIDTQDVEDIAADGWGAKTSRILETDKKGKTKDKGWTCDLVPKSLIVARYFAAEQADIDAATVDLEGITATLAELEEEHGGEEGFLGALDKINKAEVNARIKEIKGDKDAKEETAALKQWLSLNTEEAELKRAIRDAETALDRLAYDQYPRLTEPEIQTLVVDDKWLQTLAAAVQGELDRVSQTLTSRIRLLADRYAAPLPQILDEVEQLAAKVSAHLAKMGAY